MIGAMACIRCSIFRETVGWTFPDAARGTMVRVQHVRTFVASSYPHFF